MDMMDNNNTLNEINAVQRIKEEMLKADYVYNVDYDTARMILIKLSEQGLDISSDHMKENWVDAYNQAEVMAFGSPEDGSYTTGLSPDEERAFRDVAALAKQHTPGVETADQDSRDEEELLIQDRNIEALLCTKAICGVRDYLKEQHINLTVSQARQFRKHIGFDSFQTDIRSAYEAMFGKRRDGAREEGGIEAFLREAGISQGLGGSLPEYLKLEDPDSPYSLSAILSQYETLLEKKYVVKTEKPSEKRIIDVFAGSVSDLRSVNSLINPNEYRQKQLYQAANGDYPKDFHCFALSSDDLLLRSPKNDRLYHLRGTQVTDPRTDAPIESFAGASLGTYLSVADRIGMFRLRRHLTSEAYRKLEELTERYVQNEERRKDFLSRDPERKSIGSAAAILEYLNGRGIQFELREDSGPGQIRLSCEEPRMDIRLLDLKNPSYTGKIFAGGISTRLQLDGERNEDRPFVYDPQSVVDMLRYRLGESVRSESVRLKDGDGIAEHYIGQSGRACTEDGLPIRTRLPQGSAALSSAFTSTYMTGAVESVRKDNQRAVLINSDASFFPSKINIEDTDTQNSIYRLFDAMALARENFKRSIFGGNMDEYDRTEPLGIEQWDNFRRNGKTGWERDREGFVLDPVSGGRVSVADRSRDTDWEVQAVHTNDMLIYAYKESYQTYLDNEDAALIGIVDGKIQKESIEEFNVRIRELGENMKLAEDEHILAVLEAFGLNEGYTREDKLSLVKKHFAAACDTLFGYREADGGFRLNYSNILKYSGLDEKELMRILQAVRGSGVAVEYMNENEEEQQFTYNRLKERTITFDAGSAKSLVRDPGDGTLKPDCPLTATDERKRQFWEQVTRTALEALATSGLTVTALEADKNGILHYSGIRKTHRDAGRNSDSRIEGYIGQIFEPDERGVVLTKYAHENNRAFIPGYQAVIAPGEGSVETRTILRGYEQLLLEKLRYSIRSQLLRTQGGAHLTDPLDVTELNSVYRHLYNEPLPFDYMRSLRSKGLADEEIDAYIETQRGAVRYPSALKDESTISAALSADRSNFLDDRNTDGFSLTKKDMTCLETSEPGYFDRVATSTGETQGLLRYLPKGFDRHGMVDPVTGRIKPINDPNPRCALLSLAINRYGEFNPFDRQQMVFSNLLQALQYDKAAKIAHMTLQGFTMDDANVISRDYAERHLVPTQNIREVENLDPSVLQKNIDAGRFFQKGETEGTVYFMGEQYEVGGDVSSYGVQIKEKMLERMKTAAGEDRDFTGYRMLTVGDKLCDMNGNKGVISLVVDPKMDSEVAQQKGIADIVRLFQLNPGLDMASAPFTAPSRFNMGTTRGMMENPVPLFLPDGSRVEGAIGTIPMIISDKTVDDKTHIYAEESFDRNGRKASSQLAWGLQAKGAEKLMRRFYKNNASNVKNVREKMIAIGCDMNEDYRLCLGYRPHTLSEGVMENRPHIRLHLPEPLFTSHTNKNGTLVITPHSLNRKKAVDDALFQLSVHGGFLELPFALMMHEKPRVVTPYDKEARKYLLPVLPADLRTEQTFDDGTAKLHQYTRYYQRIIERAVDYEVQNSMLSFIKDVDKKTLGPQAAEKLQERRKEIEANLRTDREFIRMSYGRLKDEIIRTTFTGRKNAWKQSIMGHRLKNSATMVWTPDPTLNIEEIRISRENAEKLQLRDGDPCLVWRDPLLRPEGIACMTVKLQEETDPYQMVGAAINPAMDKRFDGDFDGDSVAIVSLNSATLSERALMEELAKRSREGELSEKEIKTICRGFSLSPFGLDRIREKLKDDREITTEAVRKFGIENTLSDLGLTPDNVKASGEIGLALNMGLDIASGYAVSENREELDGMLSEAKSHIAYGEHKKALLMLNSYIHHCEKAALGSDVVRYGSWKEYFDSLNQMIVFHEAKGKIAKAEDIAAYANVSQIGAGDGKRMAYRPWIDDATGKSHLKKDGTPQMIIDTDKPFIDFDRSALCNEPLTDCLIERNGEAERIRADEELARACKHYKEDMTERYKQVEMATSIKKYGTGLAGAYSQRAVKGLRDHCILDALELTYGATQGILQAKHDAAEARQKYLILTDVLPVLWKGCQIRFNEDSGSFEPVLSDGGYVEATRDQWVAQYRELCERKEGLDFPIHESRIQRIGDALYHQGEFAVLGTTNEKRMMQIDVYSRTAGCTLDNLAYNGNEKTLYECCERGENLYGTGKTTDFMPEGCLSGESRAIKPPKSIQVMTLTHIGKEQESIEPPEENREPADPFKVENGVLQAVHDKAVTELIVPDGVTDVADRALDDLPALERIVFPDSMEYIGREAALHCGRLFSVSVPSGAFIEEGAFRASVRIEERGLDLQMKPTLSLGH
ncbi:MAG: hypothetical protein K6G83_12960 [Lachnospiraceae bacterium]|nr:hypothetical protein [Lachnospiraceae bacterium]